MNRETMNVHKALSELKVLNNRIIDEINSSTFIVANKHSNQKIKGLPIATFCGSAVDSLKSIKSLMNRRDAIKRAVTNSNAVTKVSIAGKEYTVAEAIDMKSVGVGYRRSLLDMIEGQRKNAVRLADSGNGDALSTRADDYVRSLYQGSDVKNIAEEVKRVRDDFISAQTMELIDPIDSLKEITSLRNEIDSFMSEVDAALSTSNALTIIEVEYETE